MSAEEERLRVKLDNVTWILLMETEHPFTVDECPDPECHLCALIECPYGDPMHFSREGCTTEKQEDLIEV